MATETQSTSDAFPSAIRSRKQQLALLSFCALSALSYHKLLPNESNDTNRRQLMNLGNFHDPKTVTLRGAAVESDACPFTPPRKGVDGGIADWGGWEYDLESIA